MDTITKDFINECSALASGNTKESDELADIYLDEVERVGEVFNEGLLNLASWLFDSEQDDLLVYRMFMNKLTEGYIDEIIKLKETYSEFAE